MQLGLVQRLKLARQALYAAAGYAGNMPVDILEVDGAVYVAVDGRRIRVPSPLRWKLYRKGWAARLDRLEREYGVGDRFQLRAGDIVLDIGANAGEFAHVCARYGAIAHCFEPDPAVYDCLTENIADLDAVAIRAAAWCEDGEIDIALAPARADTSAFGDGPMTKAPAVRLETYLREHGIDRVALLKCDAEGAEPEVLEGLGGFITRVKGIALDTGPERRGARTHRECAAILEANGFVVLEEKVGTRWMTYGVKSR